MAARKRLFPIKGSKTREILRLSLRAEGVTREELYARSLARHPVTILSDEEIIDKRGWEFETFPIDKPQRSTHQLRPDRHYYRLVGVYRNGRYRDLSNFHRVLYGAQKKDVDLT